MRLHQRVGLVAIVVGLAACSGSSKPPPAEPEPVAPDAAPATAAEVPPELLAAIERAIGLVESIAVAADEGGGDCAVVARKLAAIAEGPDGDAVAAVDGHPGWEKHGEAAMAQLQVPFDGALRHLLAALEPCMDDPGVDAEMTRMGLGSGSDDPAGM